MLNFTSNGRYKFGCMSEEGFRLLNSHNKGN